MWQLIRRVLFALVWIGSWLSSSGITLAQAVPLIVRDVHVGFVAKNSMNDRTAFRSTLPGVVLSQRPAPPKPRDALAQPVGVITFEGTPTDNVDVLLEYDTSARLLGRWPHTDVRSTRALWRKLNLVQSQDAPSTPFPTTSWLNPLRESARLSLVTDKRQEKFILYDLTLRSPTVVELQSAQTGYKARNIGAAAIHDVTVYRPVGQGKFQAAYVKEIPGLGKAAPLPASANVAGTAPAQPNVVTQVLQGLAVAVGGQPVPPGAPAEGQPPTTPAIPPNTPQIDMAWTGAEQTSAELVAGWSPLLQAQGLSDPEIVHVQTILRAHAFDKDSARIVFRLDPSAIETLAPLEISPQPDKLIRVWLIILDGADPEIKTRIQQMIAALGDPSYEKRMQAKAQLVKLGPTAIPLLTAEKANKDPEISFRVEEILEEVQNPTDQGAEVAPAGVILEGF